MHANLYPAGMPVYARARLLEEKNQRLIAEREKLPRMADSVSFKAKYTIPMLDNYGMKTFSEEYWGHWVQKVICGLLNSEVCTLGAGLYYEKQRNIKYYMRPII